MKACYPLFIRFCLFYFLGYGLLSCNHQSRPQSSEIEETLHLGEVVDELDQSIWTIHQDSKGNYWFGSKDNGLYHYNGKEIRWLTEADGLPSNEVRNIQEDQKGLLYIETPAGVSQFDGHSFKTLSPIRSVNNQWRLEPDDLWFHCNTSARDILRFDGERLYELQLPRQDLKAVFGISEPDPLASFVLSPYNVFGVNKDQEGNLWIGTSTAGAYRYDGKEFIWFGEKELSVLEDGRVPGVRSIIEDQDGYFWLSNTLSKYQVSPDGQYEKLPGINLAEQEADISLPYFTSAVKDNSGNLWMTSYGQGVWKHDGEELTQTLLKDGSTEVLLISIYKDKNGKLWLGTDNAGVFDQKGERFERFHP